MNGDIVRVIGLKSKAAVNGSDKCDFRTLDECLYVNTQQNAIGNSFWKELQVNSWVFCYKCSGNLWPVTDLEERSEIQKSATKNCGAMKDLTNLWRCTGFWVWKWGLLPMKSLITRFWGWSSKSRATNEIQVALLVLRIKGAWLSKDSTFRTFRFWVQKGGCK
jgi:hypothetical protein